MAKRKQKKESLRDLGGGWVIAEVHGIWWAYAECFKPEASEFRSHDLNQYRIKGPFFDKECAISTLTKLKKEYPQLFSIR